MQAMSAAPIEPFRIAVPDADLADLRDRLARTRWPEPLDGADWAYGTDLAYLRDLCEYWANGYDWRTAEAELNTFPQFTTTVDCATGPEKVHFLHVRSANPDALPVVITHGWPGSVYEFHKIIGPLVDPAAHGGNAADAFHVVCPAICGYGFCGPNRNQGFAAPTMGEINANLMAALGYERYGAQGGDWGSIATIGNAYADPDHLVGIHLNMVTPTPAKEHLDDLTDFERAALDYAKWYADDESAYNRIQATRPQTLSFGLTDSPAGLAAWITEKFRTWMDCDGDIESVITRDELLTNISIYWFTNTIGSSVRLYRETRNLRGSWVPSPKRPVTVPTGAAMFPKELFRASRRFMEPSYNVTYWESFERGGHFAALERPADLVGSIRDFFRPLR